MKKNLQHKKAFWISAAALLAIIALVATALLTEGFGLWRKAVNVSVPAVSEPDFSASAPPPDAGEAYAHPDRLLGATLRAGIDYTVGDDGASLRSAVETAASYGFNILFFPVVDSSGQSIASAAEENASDSVQDTLAQAAAVCHDNGLLCYAVLSLSSPLGQPVDLTSTQGRQTAADALAQLVRSYALDGLLLEDAGLSGDASIDYARYLREGGGMGLDAYRRECVTAAVRQSLACSASQSAHRPVRSRRMGYRRASGGRPFVRWRPDAFAVFLLRRYAIMAQSGLVSLRSDSKRSFIRRQPFLWRGGRLVERSGYQRYRRVDDGAQLCLGTLTG